VHKCTSDPVAAPKNNQFGTILIKFGDTKKCCIFSGLELVPKGRKQLIGGHRCMHKGQKCIQTLWDHPKKVDFGEKYKECAICAILREKPRFGAYPEAKKGVERHAERSKMHSNPLGPSEKNSFCAKVRESAICAIIRGKTPFGGIPRG